MTNQTPSAELHRPLELIDGARPPESIPPLYVDAEGPTGIEFLELDLLSPRRVRQFQERLQEANRRMLGRHFSQVVNVGMEGN